MTTQAHCGNCGTACSTDRELCQAGHCVDYMTSCASIHQNNAAATNGLYTLIDGTQVYCDMARSDLMWVGVAMGQFNTTPVGFDFIRGAELMDAGAQAAFLFFYNRQNGLPVIATFSSSNCCFKSDPDPANLNMYVFGANNYLAPLTPPATGVCNPAGGYLLNTTFSLSLAQSTTNVMLAPVAADFFTTHAPGAMTLCSVGNNPGMFWKRKP
jgi:hypothetical protein